MKILYVLTRSDIIGGAQLHVRDVATAMQQQGHRVHVLVGGDGPFVELLRRHGVPCTPVETLVRPIRPWVDWRCLRDLHRAILRLNPDLVHCHSSKAGVLGRFAAWRAGVPSVFTAHGWSFSAEVQSVKNLLYRMVEKGGAQVGDRIITVSRFDRRAALAGGVGRVDQLETIWNGIDDVPASVRADAAAEPPRMIMVARFEPQKDHATLIEAVQRIRHLEWTLELVGDGPGRAAIERAAQDAGLARRVRFLGTRDDVPALLAESQIFLLASLWEGLPLSILEAMRIGLPVVASDVGGVSEEVVHGETGYLVPRQDAPALAEQLADLIQHPERRRQMGEAGRDRFVREFRSDRMLSKIECLYRRTIAANQREDHDDQSLGPEPGHPRPDVGAIAQRRPDRRAAGHVHGVR